MKKVQPEKRIFTWTCGEGFRVALLPAKKTIRVWRQEREEDDYEWWHICDYSVKSVLALANSKLTLKDFHTLHLYWDFGNGFTYYSHRDKLEAKSELKIYRRERKVARAVLKYLGLRKNRSPKRDRKWPM